MIDAGAKKLAKDGWMIVEDDGFLNLVGPLWHRGNETTGEYAIVAQAKHKNRRGFVQGGLLMTLADRSLGMAARAGIDANFRKPMNFELLTTLKRTEAHAQAVVSPPPGPECPKR